MPLLTTKGAGSASSLGITSASGPANYIEDMFGTFVYSGTGTTNNIVNGIDLAGKGGLVWTKARTTTSAFTFAHALIDTTRGVGVQLSSSLTSEAVTESTSLTAFNSNGYTLGSDSGGQGRVNNTSYGTQTYVSWTFRKQPKFFDIVTAARVSGQTNARISHNLGSVPGFVIVKSTDYPDESWRCYHQSLGRNNSIQLNSTDATFTYSNYWGTSDPTSTDFGINWNLFSGNNYVFYFFAHNAGGFGLSGTDNVISCGLSYSNSSVNLGYEPQWILAKDVSSPFNWQIGDNMRGDGLRGVNNLKANSSLAEAVTETNYFLKPTATGFDVPGSYATAGGFIYVAIRRGPMKVPTDATTVFNRNTLQSPYTTPLITNTFPVDLAMFFDQSGARDLQFVDRLRGENASLKTAEDASEVGPILDSSFDYMNGYGTGVSNAPQYGSYMFRRAPGFFDQIVYTGNGATLNLSHKLGVEPELIIFKSRSAVENWVVLNDFGSVYYRRAFLNLTNTGPQFGYGGALLDSKPSATTINLLSGTGTNSNTATYVAYLFATLAGVSKVGKYTGTGTTLQINCGFTAGARFVLIKRVDSTGDWFLWDTFRGITSGNDNYFKVNEIAVQVTNTDYIDPYSAGFELSSTAPAAINDSAGTYIFLAIA